jgi:hypothetical protein
MRWTFFSPFMASFAIACAVAPTPEANGYNVELFFQGASLGTALPVNTPALVTVRRIEQQTDLCATQSADCDPTTDTPITLVTASCDELCTVIPAPTQNGVVTLQATATLPGSTTLRVHVRSEVDGSEWDDGYPLTFRDESHTDALHASQLVIDH